MKNSIKNFGLAVALLIAGTTILQAQYGMGRGMYCPRIADLTEKQREDLADMAEKNRRQIYDLRTEMQRTTDIEKRGEIAKKIQIQRDTHKKDVLSQLTDEQKKALNSNINIPAGRGGRGPVNGNFCGRGPCGGGMGYCNAGYGRGQGRGMGNRSMDIK